jgi:hypothetical protein
MGEAPGQIALDLPDAARQQIRRYSRRWLKAGHERLRVSLAVYRTLEPLLAAYGGGAGAEPTVAELDASGPFAVAHFVRRGLEREDALMRLRAGTAEQQRLSDWYGGPDGRLSFGIAVENTRREVAARLEELRSFLAYLAGC